MTGHWAAKSAAWVLVTALVALSGGCALVAIVGRAIPKSVDSEYKGLAKQKVAVMVWADRGTRVDWPTIQIDAANTMQAYLIAKKDEDDLKEIQFPWEPRSILRFQKEHPELEGRPATEYAQRISGITRLITVEVGDFTTRSETAVQLLKGSMVGNVKVIAIEDGKATIVYERSGVRATFPPKAPEGVVDMAESRVYAGTVNAFGLAVAELFYGHIVED